MHSRNRTLSSTFSYQKLAQQQVRLLIPRRSTKKDELRFAVRAYPTDDTPSYTAISYTWGTSPANKFVYLNDTKHWVRPNLWWCLYYVSMNPAWRHIWIDYICIDQKNVQERNEQVQTMDGIFSNASLVIAWLGVETGGSDWGSYQPMECLVWDGADMEEKAAELARRPYWNRRWVVQELLLAVKVLVLCGPHCISWSTFRGWLQSGPDAAEDAVQHVAALPFLLGNDEETVHYPAHSLHDLLLEYRHTGCQDPRDRVFALLGLLSKEERMMVSPLFPNYSLSYNHVVAKTLEHLGFFQERKGSRSLALTEQCREMLDALGFKNKARAVNILCRTHS